MHANVALGGLLRVYSILVFLFRQLLASFDFCWSIGACSIEALGFALHWSRFWRGGHGTGRLCDVGNCFFALQLQFIFSLLELIFSPTGIYLLSAGIYQLEFIFSQLEFIFSPAGIYLLSAGIYQLELIFSQLEFTFFPAGIYLLSAGIYQLEFTFTPAGIYLLSAGVHQLEFIFSLLEFIFSLVVERLLALFAW